MGTTTSAVGRVGLDTPIWDQEFAERWEALRSDAPPAEPVKGKPRQKPAKTTRR
jgi:hypothetical protein